MGLKNVLFSETSTRQLMLCNLGLLQRIQTPTHTLGGILDLIISSADHIQTSCFPVTYTDNYLTVETLLEWMVHIKPIKHN